MQQRPGKRKALALAAGEVRALSVQRGVQPPLTAQETRQAHAFQHVPQRRVVCVRPGHAKIFGHGASEQIAAEAYIGHGAQQAVGGKSGNLAAAQRRAARVAPAAPCQHGGHSAFAAPAFTHDGRERALGKVHGNAVQHFAPFLVGETQVPAGQRAARCRTAARGVLGQVQQGKDLIAGSHAVHRDVEKRAELAHGQEKICRQKNDGEAAPERNAPRAEFKNGQHHAQRRPAVCHEIHDGDGIELHRQHFHGDPAEFFRLPVHLLLLIAVGLIDLQCGQPLQVFQKSVSQCRILAPVAAQQLFGKGLHRRDGGRDERHTHQKRQRGPQADGR